MANEVIKVVMFCLLWYLVSSSNNVIGKTLLNEFPYPMTVTMFQLLSITVYSGPFFNVWRVRKFVDMSWSYYAKIIVPLALGKFMISVLTHISIWKVPVSYAHTVKATMPLFSVVLSRIVLHERQTTKVYISLIPIIVGVAIATMTELSFDMLGLICALVATVQLSLQNIFSKKVLQDTGVHHLRLLHVLGRLSFFLFLPIWIYFDLRLITEEISFFSSGRYQVFALLLIDGLLNWMQNILAFTVMSMVTSLTFAVANATKRIFIIAMSLLIMGNPVTIVNVFGMMLAILGVLLYNKAKYDAKQEDIKKTILPFSVGNKNSLSNNIANIRFTKLHNKLLNGFTTNNNNYRNNLNEISPV